MNPSLTPIAIAIALALSPLAHAQTPVADPASEDADRLDTVVVTATKTAQPLAQTANSLSVLSADDIESRRVRKLEDLSASVPNLRLTNILGAGTVGDLTLRGLGNSPGSWDPSASVYIDDIPYNDFYGYAQTLFDVERIEVLRGPQGTLYGGFAEAGVIDIRSRLPGDTLAASASFGAASRANLRATASVSGPVAGSAVRLGLSAASERGEGPIRNVVDGKRGDRRADGIRFQAVLAPTDRLEATVTLMEQRIKETDGTQYLPLDRGAYNRLIAPTGFRTDDFELANDTTGERRADTSAQSLRVVWRGDRFDLIGVAARREFDGPYAFDFDYTPLRAPDTPGFGVPVISDSSFATDNDYAELRAQSSEGADAPLQWVIGVSYSAQEVSVIADGVFPEGFGLFLPPGGRAGFNDADLDGRNRALFGQATWRLLDDRLGLTAGVRRERAERRGVSRAVAFGTPPFAADVSTARTLPKLGIDWRFSEQATAYANWATGWRPGGVNLYANTSTFGGRTPDPIEYASQRTATLEAGVNLRSADDLLSLSAAVFDTRVRDYQDTIITGTGTGYLANVPEVGIRGAEAELRWRPTPALTFDAGVGYARARYRDYFFANDALDGERLANRPDWNAHAGVRWSLGRWLLGVNVNGASAFQSAYRVDGSSTRVPGHWTANISAAYRLERWSFTGYLDNVANREYFLNSNYVVAGGRVPVGIAGAPRTFGLIARYDY
jgi:iron complex outermembrane receptor protein